MVTMFGMVQRRDCLSLPLEALEPLGILGHLLRQNLEGDLAIAASGVLGKIDLAHATRTQLFENPIMGDSLADQPEFLPV